MSLVQAVSNDAEFQAALTAAGTKLVVVDFFATWCGPCQRISPVVASFSTKYPQAVFIKVDVDKCQETAAAQGVSAMPTFIFYKNKVKIDRIQGSDPNALEAKIKQYYDPVSSEKSDVAGHMDLSTFLLKEQSTVLNENDGQTAQDIIQDNNSKFVESSCDAELIFSFSFSSSVKIHSIKIKGPKENGPKLIKLFVNLPSNLDFDSANSLKAVQELELSPEDLKGKTVNLKYVKFQNVNTISVFVSKNQDDSDVTRVDYIGFVGSPINSMNMDDFTRVAGKKGESH